VQPCDAHGRVSEAQLVQVLLHARFAYSQVATILETAVANVEKLSSAKIGSAAEGQGLEYVALTQGVQRLADADLAEFERINGRGNASIEHAFSFKAQVGEKLLKALLDTSSHPEGKVVAARLRLMMALRRKTEHTAGWRPWWPVDSGNDDKKERADAKGSRRAGSNDKGRGSVGVSDAAARRERDSWRINSEGTSYVQVFEELREQEEKAKQGRHGSSQPSQTSDSATSSADQGAAESGGASSKRKKQAEKKELSEEEKAWGAAEAALRDCGIDCRPAKASAPDADRGGRERRALQVDAALSGIESILDPVPKVSFTCTHTNTAHAP